MTSIKASKLTLGDVHRLLGFEERLNDGSFVDVLCLESLTIEEQQDLQRIQDDFRPYLLDDVSEGQVKALTTFPLLRLANFYTYPIRIEVEEAIAEITIADDDLTITGRCDLVTINHNLSTSGIIPFWVLVIEAKHCSIEVRQGLPQLLTYAYSSLDRQPSVWGLVTNGLQYLFTQITAGKQPTYQLFPELHLLEPQRSQQLVQVLKAVCKLQPTIAYPLVG
jgi:hypothetical protein